MNGDDVHTSHHLDPRRRRELAPPVDALAAAVRLEQATADMRARAVAAGPDVDVDIDEPPTSLLDLAAIRAAIGGDVGDADPAAAAWLAGGADPAAARVVAEVDALAATTDKACDVCGSWETEHRHGPEVPSPRVDWVVDEVTVLTPALAAEVRAVAASAAPTSPRPPAATSAPRVFRSEHEPRPGWASRHDPRSLGYGVDRLGSAPLQAVDLPIGPVLDQGQEGECVGCGTVDATNVLRLVAGVGSGKLLNIADAAALYHRAQQLDDLPGVDYTGTSVLAGMRAGVEAGYFGGFLWAFGTRQIAAALAHGRPVVVGVPWLSGMYETGPGGLVSVAGEDRGEGHCLAVVKLRLTGPQGQPGPYFGWLNSWGRSYGDNGIGWVHHRDLAGLLAGVGEAAVPTLEPQAAT